MICEDSGKPGLHYTRHCGPELKIQTQFYSDYEGVGVQGAQGRTVATLGCRTGKQWELMYLKVAKRVDL